MPSESPPLPLPEERQATILSRLAQDGRVLSIELAQLFHTSEDTVRRDLRELAAAGHCRRVYGGALRLSPASKPITERKTTDLDAKRALARAAVTRIEPRQTVFIDTGSTNLCIAETLPSDCDLTVVTNAPAVAAALAAKAGVSLVIIGGRVDPHTGGCFGVKALRDLAGMAIDLAIVGVCAVSARGVAVFDPEEAAFKRAIVEVSTETIVAATSQKLGTVAPFGFAALDALATLVVEAGVPASALDPLNMPAERLLRAGPILKDIA